MLFSLKSKNKQTKKRLQRVLLKFYEEYNRVTRIFWNGLKIWEGLTLFQRHATLHLQTICHFWLSSNALENKTKQKQQQRNHSTEVSTEVSGVSGCISQRFCNYNAFQTEAEQDFPCNSSSMSYWAAIQGWAQKLCFSHLLSTGSEKEEAALFKSRMCKKLICLEMRSR